MTLLSPLYLLLGLAVAVPLAIHLLRRRSGVAVPFPAVRYLEQAQLRHRRTLRLRNLLLMALRVAAVLALTLAAARPRGGWLGGGGDVALAVVVDNTLSAGTVVDGRRVLDALTESAAAAFDAARSGDALWLVTADGIVSRGDAAALAAASRALDVTGAVTSMARAVARGAELARSANTGSAHVVVLTDGQRTSWPSPVDAAGTTVSVHVAAGRAPRTHAIVGVELRPPRWTPRGAVAARVTSEDSLAYRVTLAGRPLAAGTAPPASEVEVHAAPRERGWTAGAVELPPDELSADDTRHFAVWIGDPVGVTVGAAVGPFVETALDALRDAGRIRGGSDVAVVSADELTRRPALILPPRDPVRIGAANRALEHAGVPWRFGDRRRGRWSVGGAGVNGVVVTDRYELVARAAAGGDTLARVDGAPWIVAGADYVLVGSPIDPAATDLPLRAPFLPWLTAHVAERLAGGDARVIEASPGQRIARPAWADSLELAGSVRALTADSIDVGPAPGASFLRSGGVRTGALVINVPPSESGVERLTAAGVASLIRAESATPIVDASSIAPSRGGAGQRPLEGPLLALVLAALAGESIVTLVRRREADR